MQTPQLAAGALVFQLPREVVRFDEPELTSDDLT
jgi:hypothetical protein